MNERVYKYLLESIKVGNISVSIAEIMYTFYEETTQGNPLMDSEYCLTPDTAFNKYFYKLEAK